MSQKELRQDPEDFRGDGASEGCVHRASLQLRICCFEDVLDSGKAGFVLCLQITERCQVCC